MWLLELNTPTFHLSISPPTTNTNWLLPMRACQAGTARPKEGGATAINIPPLSCLNEWAKPVLVQHKDWKHGETARLTLSKGEKNSTYVAYYFIAWQPHCDNKKGSY